MIREQIKALQRDLTISEQKLVSKLIDQNFVSGLQSITKLAEDSGVSTATIIRLSRKLGYTGFPDFQNALRSEIAEQMKQPLAKLPNAADQAGGADILSQFAQATERNIKRTLETLDRAEFARLAYGLADLEKSLYLIGGRITQSNARYFFNHLQIIRPKVHLLEAAPSLWPQNLIDCDADCVVILFDIRRYESDLERLAHRAKAKGARIVLFTDQWGSPIEKYADFGLHCHVEAPSSWDSTLAINFLVEALIADVQQNCSDASKARIAELENLIGSSQIFQRF